MKDQKIDLGLLEHCLWYRKQFGHYKEPEMKSGALFSTNENPMYKQRGQYYDRRVFVYGQSTSMYGSDVGVNGPCGKGLKYDKSRLLAAKECTEEIYKGK